MPQSAYGSLPFQQQISFFRKKLNLPTNTWTDIYTAEHDWAFVVAGANRDDLVTDFRAAIGKAIEQGTTLEEFRKDFDQIVNKHGWDYKGGRGWRSRVIYETNLTQSYNAGRYEQLKTNRKAFPYLRYRHSDAVAQPRKEHLAWNGMILPADDPWWDTHFPANGWGCQCYAEGITAEEAKALGIDEAPKVTYETHIIGKSNPATARTVQVPKGISPGFEYAPGKARLESEIPPWKPMSPLRGGEGLPNQTLSDAMPAPRQASASLLLPEGLTDKEYADAFLKQFDTEYGGEPAIFKDVTGSRLVIGDSLFIKKGKQTGSKVDKRGRGPFMAILAKAVLEPDEIWVRLEYQHKQKKPVVKRRYLARFELPDRPLPALAIWEQGDDGWSGTTVFHIEDYDINDVRVGTRVYKRK